MSKKHLKPLRVRVVGSHATGKSVLAAFIAQRYSLPLLDEIARIEQVKMGRDSFDKLRTDLDAVTTFQRRVFAMQLETGKGMLRYVSDRAFDNLAYASSHADFGTAADLWERPDCKRYIQDVADDVEQRHGVVFFVRPGVVPVADGTRATGDLDVAGVHSIDGAIKLLLELGRVRYVPIHTTNFQERAMLVHSVLRYLS